VLTKLSCAPETDTLLTELVLSLQILSFHKQVKTNKMANYKM